MQQKNTLDGINYRIGEERDVPEIARQFVDLSIIAAGRMGCKEIFGIIHESNENWLQSFLRRGFTERMRADVDEFPTLPKGSKWMLVTMPVPEKEQV